jgi:hypothetical protein
MEERITLELSPEEAAAIHGVYMIHMVEMYPAPEPFDGYMRANTPKWAIHKTHAGPWQTGLAHKLAALEAAIEGAGISGDEEAELYREYKGEIEDGHELPDVE